MNRATKLFVIIISATLSACAVAPSNGLRTFPDSPNPVVDMKAMDAAKMASYDADLKDCRMIQEKSMPIDFLAEFGSPDVHAHQRQVLVLLQAQRG